MIITVDGADGVGKSTLVKRLAEHYNCKVIDKPIYTYYERKFSDCDWKRMANEKMKEIFTSHHSNAEKADFVCKFLVYLKEILTDGNDYIIDRGILSCYIFNGDSTSENVFDKYLEMGAGFDVSILLDASKDKRMERLAKRGDIADLNNQEVLSLSSEGARKYAAARGLNTHFINTDNLNSEQVFNWAKMVIDREKEYMYEDYDERDL